MRNVKEIFMFFLQLQWLQLLLAKKLYYNPPTGPDFPEISLDWESWDKEGWEKRPGTEPWFQALFAKAIMLEDGQKVTVRQGGPNSFGVGLSPVGSCYQGVVTDCETKEYAGSESDSRPGGCGYSDHEFTGGYHTAQIATEYETGPRFKYSSAPIPKYRIVLNNGVRFIFPIHFYVEKFARSHFKAIESYNERVERALQENRESTGKKYTEEYMLEIIEASYTKPQFPEKELYEYLNEIRVATKSITRTRHQGTYLIELKKIIEARPDGKQRCVFHIGQIYLWPGYDKQVVLNKLRSIHSWNR